MWWLVPETKGRTLESMDEVFGTAYGDLVEVELGALRRELRAGKVGGGREKERGGGGVLSGEREVRV